ncbi:helix-turn-helix domain-containing protein [bacterium]|nr:helix-turn-helix domain-containing protein [bacterium]
MTDLIFETDETSVTLTDSSLQSAIEKSFNREAVNPAVQSVSKLSLGRMSAYTMRLENCQVWEKNRNRIEYGDIPALARHIVAHGYPSVAEGFVKDGVFNIVDGARRLIAVQYALDNFDLTPEQTEAIQIIPIRNIESQEEFKLLARQISTDNLNKSPLERAKIIVQMMSLVNLETGKNYTQKEVAAECGLSQPSVSNYLNTLKRASEEELQKIEQGTVSLTETVESTLNRRVAPIGGKNDLQSLLPPLKSKKAKKVDARTELLRLLVDLMTYSNVVEDTDDEGDDVYLVEMSKAEYHKAFNLIRAYQSQL